jgi:hypothetical protein
MHLRDKILASFTQGTDSQGRANVAEEKQFWAKYHEAVREVRQVWGEPELGPTGSAYEGPGWRAGYQGDCPSADVYFRQLYCQALRIGWWKREGFVYAVMVTGHDANTLQILRLAVAEAREA